MTDLFKATQADLSLREVNSTLLALSVYRHRTETAYRKTGLDSWDEEVNHLDELISKLIDLREDLEIAEGIDP